jgi:DNA (cytosine-5)-methyltransferase 1
VKKFIAVELFAGGGGLSLGASRAGFDIRVAVELDHRFLPTYRVNHPFTKLLEVDVCDVKGEELLTHIPEGRIDLLMGCAPCQGFCSLTSKSQREDPRNRLVLEMVRIVEESLPSVVLMENVPGLAWRGRRLLEEFVARLEKAGYIVQWEIVQMADFGVPQHRRRLVLLAGRGFSIPMPSPTHTNSALRPKGVKPWRTLHDAIYGEPTPLLLTESRKRGGPSSLKWHVVRDLGPSTKARLKAVKPGQMRTTLSDELLPECHRGGYSGFRNVYMRMSWDKPSSTITAGCTTPAKGRFGHPKRNRTTISVREAATIQTFPKTYRIVTDNIDVACQMIGNAVPPRFGECLASQALETLKNNNEKLGRNR